MSNNKKVTLCHIDELDKVTANKIVYKGASIPRVQVTWNPATKMLKVPKWIRDRHTMGRLVSGWYKLDRAW